MSFPPAETDSTATQPFRTGQTGNRRGNGQPNSTSPKPDDPLRKRTDRRSGKERRNGQERRLQETPFPLAERRSGTDRRAIPERRTGRDRRNVYREIKKRRIPISIQLAALTTLLMLLAIATISIVILEREKRQFTDQLIDLGQSMVRLAASNSPDKLLVEDDLALFRLVNDITVSEKVLFAAITDHNNIIRAHSRIEEVNKPYFEPERIRSVRQDKGIVTSIIVYEADEILFFEAPITYQKLHIGKVYIGISREDIQRNLRKATLSILALTFGIMIASILLSLMLSLFFSHPIRRLVEATRALGKGDFTHRVKIKRNDEMGDLASAFNRMAAQLGLMERIKGSFGRYVTPELVEMILAKPDSQWMKGAEVEATVLFVDIRGFTGLSEDKDPESVIELLNQYFTRVTDIVIRHGGHLNKFVGDEAMAIFGAPVAHSRHAEAAVRAALDMQREIERFDREKQVMNDTRVRVGIGINSGPMVAGNLGSEKRMEYTVIGDNVNIASRLTDLAPAGEIMISRRTHELITSHTKVRVEKRGFVPVKGKRVEIEVLKVLGIDEGANAKTQT